MDHEGQASLINPASIIDADIIAAVYPRVNRIARCVRRVTARESRDRFEISNYEFPSHPRGRVNPPLLSRSSTLCFQFLLEINIPAMSVNGIPKQACMYSGEPRSKWSAILKAS